MPLPLIPLIIAGGAALAGQGVSMYNENEGAKKGAEFEEMVRQKRQREARRQALQQILGRGFITKGYEDPRAPDLSQYAIRAGLGKMLGQAGSMVAGGMAAAGAGGAGGATALPGNDISSSFAGMA